MPLTDDLTTLICLFHHDDQAQAAVRDLLGAGVPQSSLSLINKSGSATGNLRSSSLDDLDIPERDLEHLRQGVQDGGTIVAVSAISEHVETVEEIFSDHRAEKIDEVDLGDRNAAPLPVAGLANTAGETSIPIVEEELAVGKRTVDAGGVRVYRRVVEIPAEASVNLREEHVVVERTAVDRAASAADLAQTDRTIELTETAEEAIVGKSARVVEEVHVGKDASERVEHIRDTVRKTEVDVEELPSGTERVDPSGVRGDLDRY